MIGRIVIEGRRGLEVIFPGFHLRFSFLKGEGVFTLYWKCHCIGADGYFRLARLILL